MGMSCEFFNTLEDAEQWQKENKRFFTWIRIKKMGNGGYKTVVRHSEYKMYSERMRGRKLAQANTACSGLVESSASQSEPTPEKLSARQALSQPATSR